jgi:lycopene beta-cyclase
MEDDKQINTSTSIIKYDYIFCGVGASASLLLLELNRNNLLDGSTVLLIDQGKKTKNDKTFCFWAEDKDPISSNLRELISHSWNSMTLSDSTEINLFPLKYNHISSIDLYLKIEELATQLNWQKLTTKINDISSDEISPYITIEGNLVRANRIFDSRSPVYLEPKNDEIHIFQSFVGWLIETKSEINQAHVIRFMDFRIDQQNQTQFVYVLPFSKNKLLVEITRFGLEIMKESEVDILLHQYIKSNFGDYTKLDLEIGCIPMSQREIQNDCHQGVVLLGARNYGIKPSTGYAFKNMYYHAKTIADSIKKNEDIIDLNKNHKQAFKNRFGFYDSLLLDILKNNPHEGKAIFIELFKKVETIKILKFLDEKTNIIDDISIFYKLNWSPFLKSLAKRVFKNQFIQPIFLCFLTIIFILLGNNESLQETAGYWFIAIGLITIGIPHGAVDHLLETGKWEYKKSPVFIIKYLLLSFIVLALWYWIPALGLILFLIYSSWHFGQADAKVFGLSVTSSFLWGTSVLLYIVGTHQTETNQILAFMGGVLFPVAIPKWTISAWIIFALYKKNPSFIITICWLTLASFLPLIISFSLYFIGQHSYSSWLQLKSHLKMDNKKIWLNSLPFHGAAWLMLAILYLIAPENESSGIQKYAGQFFIFIACISFPHVIYMQTVYKKKL